MAVYCRISTRSSEGILEMGHGGGGNSSCRDETGRIESEENDAMSWAVEEAGGPSRE